MQNETRGKSLPTKKFLTVAVNLLNTAILEAKRSDARRLFRELEQGKTVTITNLEMEDKSLVRVDVALDHELYQGELNFGSFRTGVALLLAKTVEALKSSDKIQTFQSENDPNSLIFGSVAITVEDSRTSVLVLGSETGGGEPVIRLKLAYLDFVQFQDQLTADGDAGDSASV